MRTETPSVQAFAADRNQADPGRVTRRAVFRSSTLAAASGILARGNPAARPNILWITCEDTSPDLGCYGDSWARTPNLDRLASQGARYTNAFSVYGVCAPSRSSIITGMYPASIGTHHMRSQGVPPPHVRCFTEYLRAAGYYCTNNSKTDYNFPAPLTAWDESGNRAHWRKRPKDQPFFSVFNITTTHESQIWPANNAKATAILAPEERHDPVHAKVPPYYPDTPLTRRDWANYYDLVTAMDKEAAGLLRQLENDGLAENTIVFFYGDHGRGLPRAKRWAYEASLHVPLIVRWPGTIAPGTVPDRLVSLMDLGPTLLSIAGVEIPKYMQGRAFLGDKAAPPRQYIFGARDRMDEAYDLIRAARDKRFHYIRNFQFAKPYAQYIDYMETGQTMKEMRRLNKAGELQGPQRLFFAPEKEPEELYDIPKDPHCIHNLAAAPAHRGTLKRMRAAVDEWMREINDLGGVPEEQLKERMRPGGKWSVTAAPKITPDGGSFTAPVAVRLACPTEGSSIAWTTEQGENSRWKLYGGEIALDRTATLRVKACRLGWEDSPEVRAEFKIG